MNTQNTNHLNIPADISEILVVDDSYSMRTELCTVLSANELMVHEAENADDAIVIMSRNPKIKLILSDYNMPNTNGLEMVRYIRQTLGNHSVNVLLMSTESNATVKTTCKELGVAAWILKPLNISALLPVIKKLVNE